MAAKIKLEKGTAYIAGRSSAKAKELIERLGDGEGEIVTTAFGYIVPASIVEDGDKADTKFANGLHDGTVASEEDPEGDESKESEDDESKEPAKAERKSRTRKGTDTEEGK